MIRRVLAVLVAAVLLTPMQAAARCAAQPACPPCGMCRVPAATGANLSPVQMSALFDQIAAGPAVYGTLGWNFVGGATVLGTGIGNCGMPGPMVNVPAHFPCLLLKAIYATESNWTQFCSTGLTVIAFDCGYGIAQVTTGMNVGDTSAFDPNRVAAEPAYNVSVGAEILAQKWQATACVGGNDPDVIEDWYFAVWGYNGLTFGNNPNNPMYAANRPEFRTPGIASAQVRGNYPYQEVVWGYAHYPPGPSYYTGMQLAYPDPATICSTCGRPGNIPEPVGAHVSTCPPMQGTPDGGLADGGGNRDAAMDGFDEGMSDVRVSDASADESPTDATAGMDVGGSAESTPLRSGCGCRVPGRSTDPRWTEALLVAGALFARRRRGARRATDRKD